MFTQDFAKENKRLSQLITLIPQAQQEQLAELITQKDGISPFNILRSDQKNFKYMATRAEVDKALSIAELYTYAKGFLREYFLNCVSFDKSV